jgi:Protein of unknown function (DUF1553)/Protein of unknown function (DUF1549)
MVWRRWIQAALSLAAFALIPANAHSQAPSYNRDAVKALSQRIDQHLAKVWKKAGVTPAEKADDHVFFRRLNLDLVGRIPDLIQLGDFVDPTNDSPTKRWDAVDRFLDDPDHAEHFANVWRSLILGNQTNQQFQFLLPQFELWLRDRVEGNVTLDKMVLQLLTSSQQGNQPIQFPGGNGQLRGSPQLFFQVNENKAENLAGHISRAFLGVKIECAQCHKHPFASWKQEQFWEFAAFYSNNQGIRKGQQPVKGITAGREIQIPNTDKVVKSKFLTGVAPTENEWKAGSSRTVVANWVISRENPYFAKAMADHLWTYLMGVSLLEPIMEPSDDSPITHDELLADLAKALMENDFDAKFLIRAIVHSDAYQRSSRSAKLAEKEDYQLFVRMPIRVLSAEQIFDSIEVAAHKKRDRRNDRQMNNQFFPGQMQTPRAQFMTKFANQDRRHEPQTSILQSLFLMNGKFMGDLVRYENNADLQTLATQNTSHAQRVKSLYMWVLSRPPRQDETDRLVRYLRERESPGEIGAAVSDIYWALLNSSEFLLNH